MNRLEAKKHWLNFQKETEAWALRLTKKISAIEDPILRHAVASIVDGISSGYGHIAIQRTKDSKIIVHGFVLDGELMGVLDAALRSCFEDPEESSEPVMREAVSWLRAETRDGTALDLAWNIGVLRDMTPLEIVPSELKISGRLSAFTINHIVYDLKKEALIGVRLDDGSLFRPPGN